MRRTISMRKDIYLKPIKRDELYLIWAVSYGPKADLEWMKYNGPYFNNPVESWTEFAIGYGESLIDNPMCKAIVVNNQIIGLVTAYWEDGGLRQWLEVGILIYDSRLWRRNIGTIALSMWITELFDKFEHLPHIGFTTWSGNPGMEKIGTKCGMKEEARIRKVRYVGGNYYDSVKYGILRDELKN